MFDAVTQGIRFAFYFSGPLFKWAALWLAGCVVLPGILGAWFFFGGWLHRLAVRSPDAKTIEEHRGRD
jgi:hypothetical protein